jgi:hypothetical protein
MISLTIGQMAANYELNLENRCRLISFFFMPDLHRSGGADPSGHAASKKIIHLR